MLLLSIIQAEKSFSICHANIFKLIVNYWNMHKNTFLFRLPLSQKSPFGYSIYAIFSGMQSFCINYCVVPGMCFLIGSSSLFICFTKDAANDLLLLNINGKLKRNRAEAKRRFLNIVRLYTDMKELSVTKKDWCTSTLQSVFFMQDHWRIQHHLWVPDVCCLCMDHFRYEIK